MIRWVVSLLATSVASVCGITLAATGTEDVAPVHRDARAAAAAIAFDATINGQQRGDGVGNVCAGATNVVFIPGAGEFRWSCSGFDGRLKLGQEATYDYAPEGRRVTAVGSAATPIGTGGAFPASAGTGTNVLLFVDVTPASEPASTGIQVAANLAAIGGLPSTPLVDDGTGGDVAAGDKRYSARVFVALGTGPGAKSLPVGISDGQGRASAAAIPLTVLQPSNPIGTGTSAPAVVARGARTLLRVAVSPGVSPPSTNLEVAGILSSLGADNAFFSDAATNGDAVAGDGVYSYSVLVGNDVAPGSKSVPVVISDGQNRTSTAQIPVEVLAATALVATSSASPSTLVPTETAVIRASITPGVSPTSSGIAVDADSVPGLTLTSFRDDGVAPDAAPGDLVFTANATVVWGASAGPRTLTVHASDMQGRVASTDTALTVLGSTGLSALAVATPEAVSPDEPTLLTVQVAPGTRPHSTGIAVTADLTEIGGEPAQLLVDDGTSGDATANDGIFSFRATVESLTPSGSLTLPVVVTDAQTRTANVGLALEIVGPGELRVQGAAVPRAVLPGQQMLLEAAVTPATIPPSTGIGVGANLSAIGGSATQLFADDGLAGDAAANDNVFSFRTNVPVGTPAGGFRLPVLARDEEGREASAGITVEVRGDALFGDSFD